MSASAEEKKLQKKKNRLSMIAMKLTSPNHEDGEKKMKKQHSIDEGGDGKKPTLRSRLASFSEGSSESKKVATEKRRRKSAGKRGEGKFSKDNSSADISSLSNESTPERKDNKPESNTPPEETKKENEPSDEKSLQVKEETKTDENTNEEQEKSKPKEEEKEEKKEDKKEEKDEENDEENEEEVEIDPNAVFFLPETPNIIVYTGEENPYQIQIASLGKIIEKVTTPVKVYTKECKCKTKIILSQKNNIKLNFIP